jgi:hypothetical protein
MSQRRSNPVNGSVLDFAVVVVGVLLVVSGDGSVVGVVLVGFSDSFDGSVPVLGVVVAVVGVVVAVVGVVGVVGVVVVPVVVVDGVV